MAIIVPTVMPTTDNPHVFRDIMERVTSYAKRIHIDLMDGDFAPHRNIASNMIWWPEGVQADVHLMYRRPLEVIDDAVASLPSMIIIHAEAEGDLVETLRRIKETGVRAGVSFLRTTNVYDHRNLVEQADHVMLFGGELGGDGHGELAALEKISDIRSINSSVEIGWDGGADSSNIYLIVDQGVSVINVGAALRNAQNPAAEFDRLSQLAGR
ncbi:hypothetical protein EOL73_00465 [Candidatus Saccharibacteria bacterium]|nr:hypothetical protein [Candidatus Saccharibacteria bacterium]NCU40215.1 hypothetical protein [Candidatus Saccharibacteria bacterium]